MKKTAILWMLFCLCPNVVNAKLATQECMEADIGSVRKVLCTTVMAPFDVVGVAIPVTGMTLSVAGAAAGAIVEAPVTIPWTMIEKMHKPSGKSQYYDISQHNRTTKYYSAPQYYGTPQYYNNY